MLHLTVRMPQKVSGQENSWREGPVTSEADRIIDIPRIDVGPDGRYVFYVWNCCVYRLVKVSALAYATISGEGKSRERLQVKQSTINFFQSLMRNELESGGSC